MNEKPTIEFIRAEFAKEGYELLTTEYQGNKQKLEGICPVGHKYYVNWSNWNSKRKPRCPYCVGNAKLNIEFICAEFAKEGYTLLTKVYENSKQKLDYVCSKGHKHSTNWGNWKFGKRCPYCHGNIKLTIKFIKSEFEKEGYNLLTKVYKNSKQKLNYICPKGHRHFIRWNSWQREKRCPYCAGNIKLNIEFIKKEFEKENYQLLTKVYKNNKQKLDYICSKGHKHNIKWNDWKSGYRCPYCAGNIKLNIEFIRAEFKKEGYTLLSTEYKNNRQKLDYICPNNHKHSISWYEWCAGNKCPHCSKYHNKYSIEDVKLRFMSENYILLTKKYNNRRQRLDYICPNGHKYFTNFGNWIEGCRCPFCSNSVSKWEKTVKKFLGSLNINYIPNDRTQLLNPKTGCSLELDIWMPQLNKAIECNGLYWHSKPVRKECDKIKKQLCKKQGIDLLTITDKEWNEDINKCKNKIQEFFC